MKFLLCTERETSEIVTDQDIRIAIKVKIIHAKFPPWALWYVMRLEGLLGNLRPLDTFLTSLCVVLNVSVNSNPVHVFSGILLYLVCREMAFM